MTNERMLQNETHLRRTSHKLPNPRRHVRGGWGGGCDCEWGADVSTSATLLEIIDMSYPLEEYSMLHMTPEVYHRLCQEVYHGSFPNIPLEYENGSPVKRIFAGLEIVIDRGVIYAEVKVHDPHKIVNGGV